MHSELSAATEQKWPGRWHCGVLVKADDPRQVYHVHSSCEQNFAKGGSERRRYHRLITLFHELSFITLLLRD